MDIENLVELIKTGKNDNLEEQLRNNPSLADEKTAQGISLLQFACYCRNKAAIDTIAQHKKELDIFEAASIGDTGTVSQLLVKQPELLHSFSSDGFTALGLATFFGHLPLVKLLLDKGSNPNIASNNQFKVAPIHSACAISNFDIVELLIKHGADVNAKQMQGVTPLHSAAHNGQTQIAELLINNGADINAGMENGQTPLFMANEKGFKGTAAFLIVSGAH